MRPEGLGTLKKGCPIGCRTRDFPACSYSALTTTYRVPVNYFQVDKPEIMFIQPLTLITFVRLDIVNRFAAGCHGNARRDNLFRK
jgi:hypothetical protein